MVDRRSFLATLGAVGLAGCLSGDDPGSTDTGTPTDSTSTQPSTPTGTPATPERIDSAWPVPNHDPGLTNYAPGATGPTTKPGELWRVSTDTSLSPPVVADGTLYVGGDDGTVRAFDARNGEQQWLTPVGAAARTPHLIDGRVYVPTADGVVALDTDGDGPEWQIETPDRRGFLAAVHGVYYVSAGAEPAVVALDRRDGSERWRTPIQDPWQLPLFAGAGQVFVSTGGSWDVPWRFAVDTGEYLGEERPPRGGADFVVSEFYLGGAVFGGKELFSTVTGHPVTADGYEWNTAVEDAACFEMAGGAEFLFAHAKCIDRTGLFALSLDDGSEVWYADSVPDIVGRPVVADDAVLVSTEAELHCFAPDDGATRWQRSADDVGEQFAVADDLLFTTQGETVRALR